MLQFPIQTFCRIKPSHYPGYEEQVVYSIEESETFTKIIIDNQVFFFDSVFGPTIGNGEIFRQVLMPLIQHMFHGVNATLLAYGQTGGGKTYTVSAMINKTLHHIMSRPDKGEVYLSYLQLYSERCYDLLNSNKEVTLTSGMFDVTHSDQTNGLHIRKLSSIDEAISVIELGCENKVTAVTNMNASSSRSHSICTIYLSHLLSKLHLVDLAGSEQFFSVTDDYLLRNEAKKINLSLHYLEQVMIALDEPQRRHIPYRNSTLTSILRDSLGGNGITSMIAVVSMDRCNQHQTIATLKFAQRTLRVKNQILQNNRNKSDTLKSEDVPNQSLLDKMHTHHYTTKESKVYKKEIEKLKHKVKLRDKEIGVLLEMLTTHELNNLNTLERKPSGHTMEDNTLYTDIDAMFRDTEEDSFIVSNFKMFTSEELLGFEVSGNEPNAGVLKHDPNLSNTSNEHKLDTATVTRYSGSGDLTNDNSVSTSCDVSTSVSTSCDPVFHHSHSSLTSSSHREGKAGNDKGGRFIFSKPMNIERTKDISNHNRFGDYFNYSISDGQKTSQKRHVESPVYNSLNVLSKHNPHVRHMNNYSSTSSEIEAIHKSVARPNKSILRKTERSHIKSEAPSFHVTFAGLETPVDISKRKHLETDNAEVIEVCQHTRNTCEGNISNCNEEHVKHTKTIQAGPNVRKNQTPNKKCHKTVYNENNFKHAEEIGEIETTVGKDNSDVMNATDPSIVKNIEQYLTGDPIIDEEIIQFYARRGIVVNTAKFKTEN